MNLEIVKETLKKVIPLIVILSVLVLITLGVVGIIILLDKIELGRFETFQDNARIVIEKLEQSQNAQQNYLGISCKDSEIQEKYMDAINEINQLFNIDIVNEDYYFLDDTYKQIMGIENIEQPFIVNYKNGIVFCLEPVKYNGEKYYAVEEMQKRLQKKYGYNVPIIPNGFMHKTGGWNNGYVIYDNLGNEFVWVPVGMINHEQPSKAFRAYYLDKNKQGEMTEEYTNILNSIDKYGGFYISRFEASLQGATEESSIGTKNVLQVKQNVIPVSQVSFTTSDNEENNKVRGYNSEGKSVESGSRKGAVELAQDMAKEYNWEENGLHTALMYQEHYDTVMYIVQLLGVLDNSKVEQKNPITQDSTLWGNYINSTFKYEKNGEMHIKDIEEGVLLPTGTRVYNIGEQKVYMGNNVFNIYDLAGNVAEWTMNANRKGNSIRGGSYSSNGELTNAGKYVYVSPDYSSANLGIRVVMYID